MGTWALPRTPSGFGDSRSKEKPSAGKSRSSRPRLPLPKASLVFFNLAPVPPRFYSISIVLFSHFWIHCTCLSNFDDLGLKACLGFLIFVLGVSDSRDSVQEGNCWFGDERRVCWEGKERKYDVRKFPFTANKIVNNLFLLM